MDVYIIQTEPGKEAKEHFSLGSIEITVVSQSDTLSNTINKHILIRISSDIRDIQYLMFRGIRGSIFVRFSDPNMQLPNQNLSLLARFSSEVRV